MLGKVLKFKIWKFYNVDMHKKIIIPNYNEKKMP